MHFNVLEFVRAIEIEFSPRTGIDEDFAVLAPLTVWAKERADGTVVLLAWDPSGRGMAGGRFDGITSLYWPIAARAWGDGGRPLPLTLDGRTLTIGDGNAPVVSVVTAAPTPFRGATTIRWRMNDPGAATIRLFDVRGSARRTWSRVNLSAGDYLFNWDGRDDVGAPVPSGIYFARVTLPDGEYHLRLVRVGR